MHVDLVALDLEHVQIHVTKLHALEIVECFAMIKDVVVYVQKYVQEDHVPLNVIELALLHVEEDVQLPVVLHAILLHVEPDALLDALQHAI